MARRLPVALVPALLLVAGLLAGCGSADPVAQADAAQSALGTGDAAGARAQAEEGLKANPADKNLAWRLERIRVEAIAKQGDSREVLTTVTRLQPAYPQQCDAAFYAKLGAILVDAGQPVGAVELADAGIKQFPDRKPDFEGLINSIQAGGDAEAVAKLKAMGYL